MHLKLGWWRHKNYHNSKNRNQKNLKFDTPYAQKTLYSLVFPVCRWYQLVPTRVHQCKKNPRLWMLFGGERNPTGKKREFFFQDVRTFLMNIFSSYFFFLKWSNLHGISGIDWIERKSNFMELVPHCQGPLS